MRLIKDNPELNVYLHWLCEEKSEIVYILQLSYKIKRVLL